MNIFALVLHKFRKIIEIFRETILLNLSTISWVVCNAVSVGNQIKFDWRISEKWQFHVQFHEKKIFFFSFFLLVFLSKVKVYKLPARYNYDTSTTISMSSKNLLRDPFEQQTVYIGQSQIHPEAGEGLFAKRHSVRFC